MIQPNRLPTIRVTLGAGVKIRGELERLVRLSISPSPSGEALEARVFIPAEWVNPPFREIFFAEKTLPIRTIPPDTKFAIQAFLDGNSWNSGGDLTERLTIALSRLFAPTARLVIAHARKKWNGVNTRVKFHLRVGGIFFHTSETEGEIRPYLNVFPQPRRRIAKPA